MNLIMYIYLQQEAMLFFEPSEISKIQEMDAGTTEYERANGWEVKLLKWQQHILKQLIHGIHPSKPNICNILCALSSQYTRESVWYTGLEI